MKEVKLLQVMQLVRDRARILSQLFPQLLSDARNQKRNQRASNKCTITTDHILLSF